MPNTILSIDQYSVVSWEKYVIVTLFSNLQSHHILLLEECIKKRENFGSTPVVLDCVRLSEAMVRERDFLIRLKETLQSYVVLSNSTFNAALQKAGIYDLLPIATDFKGALQRFGIEYQPKLDAKLVNTFVESTIKVLSAQTGKVPSVGKPVAQKTPIVLDLFGIIPTHSSHFSGNVLLSFTDDILRTLFVDIFNYEPEKVSCEAEEFLSELLELIHETTRGELLNNGYIFYPSSASIIRKANMTDHISKKQVFLNVPLQYKDNLFQMCIGVEAL